MAWGYQAPDLGEKFDGRFLFHQRRSNIHEEIAQWSIKAMEDPKYLGRWCGALQQLHRMLWGSLGKAIIKIKGKKINFNNYLQIKLRLMNKKILTEYQYNERSDGTIYIKVNRDKLKPLYLILDKIQKQLAEMEYKKNLDLPKTRDPVEECTMAV